MRALLSMLFVGGAVVLSVASGPAPPEDPPENVDPPAWDNYSDVDLELGIGYYLFYEYERYGGVYIESGFQGGQHVNGAIQTEDPSVTTDLGVDGFVWLVDPDTETVLAGAQTRSGTFEDLSEYYPDLVPAGRLAFSELRLVLTDDEVDQLLGRFVEVRVHLDLSDGRVGRAFAQGVLDWVPDVWPELPDEDAGVPDGGAPDGGPVDAGGDPVDGGPTDGGLADGGSVDAGPGDAGPVDAGPVDAGPVDAGPVDAGPVDAGPVDAGPVDGGAAGSGSDGGGLDGGAAADAGDGGG